jgi:hypothetical protein
MVSEPNRPRDAERPALEDAQRQTRGARVEDTLGEARGEVDRAVVTPANRSQELER